ncbi:aldehyde dehydrogenase (NADP(+)) [Nocardioides carbamazepini]|uniref:aldehyde dehydrogenase (NADP(+)) n=1 Tax=Nocardioides carbamazepini TaxID=2854259 RepID=UPI002149E2E2|nr:aldehyde dehydrogenase (NADP(+)) [Nocardioides carbamazepini]MCR1784015.1 aldehyde dehydrogenase (NADP(+)) [Nocardioides carbamazepini]
MKTIESVDARTGETLGRAAVETTADQVDAAVARATAAVPWLASQGRAGRARLLDDLSTALESRADELVETADRETALGVPRLTGELARTCYQLRFLGRVALEGSYLDVSIEHAGATPAGPLPDLRRMNVPVGPIAVFGASNFPLAFSAPGGDTASALAAGCPVIVKAHGSHPALSRLVAEVFDATLLRAGAPSGVFQLVFGLDAGTALVRHPGIRAVGFTGSIAGGRALFDLAAARPEPIPFYGELGSVNPLVVTTAAAEQRGEQIAADLAASLTMGTGQFCTKPGLLLVPSGPAGDRLVDRLVTVLGDVGAGHLLNDGITTAFRSGLAQLLDDPAVALRFAGAATGRQVAPVLAEARPSDMHTTTAALLIEEYFGPFGLVMRYRSTEEVRDVLSRFPAALTGTVHSAGDTDPDLAAIAAWLRERCGRLVFDGYPTGVAVAWGMHHGGRYPASTSASTSVGASSIARWVHPIAFQNAPASVLPPELRDDVDEAVPRRINGILELT